MSGTRCPLLAVLIVGLVASQAQAQQAPAQDTRGADTNEADTEADTEADNEADTEADNEAGTEADNESGTNESDTDEATDEADVPIAPAGYGEPAPATPGDAPESAPVPAFPGSPAAKTTRREGIIGGLALGFGTLASGDDSNGTLNYQLRFGGFLSDRIALSVSFWGGSHADGEFGMTNTNRGIAAQYWFGESLWTSAAVGTADLRTYFGDVLLAEFAGAALEAGLGWMFYERGHYHVDARLGITVEGYRDTRNNMTATAIQLGLQYY